MTGQAGRRGRPTRRKGTRPAWHGAGTTRGVLTRLAALSLGLLLCACAPAGSPPDSQPGGKGDDPAAGAACAADELETLELCLTDGCPDLSGDALETCLQETCGEDLERVEDGCEACVVGGLDAGAPLAEVSQRCGAAADGGLCSADDFEWLFFCRDEGCPDAEDLDTCLQETCGEEIEAMSEACRGCFVAASDEGASATAIEATCGAAAETGPACAGDDAEAVSLCLSEGCPEQSGEALAVCLQETCGADLERVADGCKLCVVEHTGLGSAGVAESCL